MSKNEQSDSAVLEQSYLSEVRNDLSEREQAALVELRLAEIGAVVLTKRRLPVGTIYEEKPLFRWMEDHRKAVGPEWQVGLSEPARVVLAAPIERPRSQAPANPFSGLLGTSRDE